jgi:hypothetical protein
MGEKSGSGSGLNNHIVTIAIKGGHQLCCGSGMFIRLFSIPDPGSDFFHPGSASKSESILSQKNGFSAPGNMIGVVYPGSGF